MSTATAGATMKVQAKDVTLLRICITFGSLVELAILQVSRIMGFNFLGYPGAELSCQPQGQFTAVM